MSFFFYLPNLVVAEFFLRARRLRSHTVFRGFALAVMIVATLVVGVGTYYFLRFYWGPGILDAVRGLGCAAGLVR
jgi:ABC-type spermidine/putrescine transport system permease subunit II